MLYLIRHGATEQPMLRPPGDLTPATHDEWLLDYGLSGRGVRESQALGSWLARLEAPDRVVSSPKRRTQETARHAAPGRTPSIDERWHEWHENESDASLLARTRSVLAEAENGTTWAFTHGGFIRAVVASLLVGADDARFAATFHDLRRATHVWNASVTLVGHGASGLELYAVNQCPALDALLGRD